MKKNQVFKVCALAIVLLVASEIQAEPDHELKIILIEPENVRPAVRELSLAESFDIVVKQFLEYSPSAGTELIQLDRESFDRLIPPMCIDAIFVGTRPLIKHIQRVLEDSTKSKNDKIARKYFLERVIEHLSTIEKEMKKNQCKLSDAFKKDLTATRQTVEGLIQEKKRTEFLVQPKPTIVDPRTLLDVVTTLTLHTENCAHKNEPYKPFDPQDPPAYLEELQTQRFNQSFQIESLQKCAEHTQLSLERNLRLQKELEKRLKTYEDRLKDHPIDSPAFNQTLQKIEATGKESRDTETQKLKLEQTLRYLNRQITLRTPRSA